MLLALGALDPRLGQHKAVLIWRNCGPLWLCDARVLRRSRWKGLSWVPLAAPLNRQGLSRLAGRVCHRNLWASWRFLG